MSWELLLLGEDRLHRGDVAVGELDLDHVGADLADRLLEADSAVVAADVTRVADRRDYLFRPDRAEELAVFARPLVDRQHCLREQRGGLSFARGAFALGFLRG